MSLEKDLFVGKRFKVESPAPYWINVENFREVLKPGKKMVSRPVYRSPELVFLGEIIDRALQPQGDEVIRLEKQYSAEFKNLKKEAEESGQNPMIVFLGWMLGATELFKDELVKKFKGAEKLKNIGKHHFFSLAKFAAERFQTWADVINPERSIIDYTGFTLRYNLAKLGPEAQPIKDAFHLDMGHEQSEFTAALTHVYGAEDSATIYTDKAELLEGYERNKLSEQLKKTGRIGHIKEEFAHLEKQLPPFHETFSTMLGGEQEPWPHRAATLKPGDPVRLTVVGMLSKIK